MSTRRDTAADAAEARRHSQTAAEATGDIRTDLARIETAVRRYGEDLSGYHQEVMAALGDTSRLRADNGRLAAENATLRKALGDVNAALAPPVTATAGEPAPDETAEGPAVLKQARTRKPATPTAPKGTE